MKRWLSASLALVFYASVLPWNANSAGWNYNVHNLTGDGGAMSNVRVPADNVFLVSGDNTLSVNDAVTAWADARAYGAVLDNTSASVTAANSVAIQAAITAGNAVLIPPGHTLSYDTTLVLKTDLTLFGYGESSILQYTGTGSGITGLTGTRLFRIILKDFTLMTNNLSNTGTGIKLQEYDSYVKIYGLNVTGFGEAGIHITGNHNEVRMNKVSGRALVNGGSNYGIIVKRSTTALTIPTTIKLDHNYISTIVNGSTTGTAIMWDNTYKCNDVYNITEASDIGRSLDNASMTTVIHPYYESNSTDQKWNDSTGTVIGYNDPNAVATWATTTANARLIRFIPTVPQIGIGLIEQSGSQKINGSLEVTRGLQLGYEDYGDANRVFDLTSLTISAFTPSTPRTYTLPTAVGIKGVVVTALKPTGSNKVTLTPNGAETIGGAASYYLLENGEHVTVISDNVNWQVIEAGGVRQAANADTAMTFTGTDNVSKAEVVLLQTEVNELKAALRSFGILAQ